MNMDILNVARNQNNDLLNKYINQVRRDQSTSLNSTARTIDDERSRQVPTRSRLINSFLPIQNPENDSASNDFSNPLPSSNSEFPKGSRKDLFINPIGSEQKQENKLSSIVKIRQEDDLTETPIPFSSNWYL